MEKEPFIPSYSKIPRTPSQLSHLPEDNEISIPASLTGSEFNDMLIFDSPKSSSQTVDALNSRVNIDDYSDSLKPFVSCSDSNVGSNPIPVINPDLQIQIPHSWSVDPNNSFQKANLHCSETTINEFDHPSHPRSQQSASSSIVRQWVVLLIMYLSLGVVIYCSRENIVDSETHVAVEAL
ncbi:hypothetical protein L2E82_14219 [Cichorium intybus]|uniref:Uncharacterized protein n=1 Tax=Cichorium intybus TaxID=13427 RepID=A0ACB9EZU8_CICIN|nr:hypothetical protein L2E82_14219 [Cichorium intybus]